MINCSYPLSSWKQWMALIHWVKSPGQLEAMRNHSLGMKKILPLLGAPLTSQTEAAFTSGLFISSGRLFWLSTLPGKKYLFLARAQQSQKSQFHRTQIGGALLIKELPRIPGSASIVCTSKSNSAKWNWCERSRAGRAGKKDLDSF